MFMTSGQLAGSGHTGYITVQNTVYVQGNGAVLFFDRGMCAL
jgi:hypothetical protein